MGYVDVELGIAEVGIVGKCLVYEVSQHGVGEHVLPTHVAKGSAVDFGFAGFLVFGCERRIVGHVEFLVYVTTAEGGGGKHRPHSIDGNFIEVHD